MNQVPGASNLFAANDNYFGGVPKVRTVTVLFGLDDTARAQRVRSGEVDSAPLPATLARQFDKASGFRVISDRSADYRAITMPMRSRSSRWVACWTRPSVTAS